MRYHHRLTKRILQWEQISTSYDQAANRAIRQS